MPSSSQRANKDSESLGFDVSSHFTGLDYKILRILSGFLQVFYPSPLLAQLKCHSQWPAKAAGFTVIDSTLCQNQNHQLSAMLKQCWAS